MKYNKHLGLVGIAEAVFFVVALFLGLAAFESVIANADGLEIVPTTIGDIKDVEGQATIVSRDFEIHLQASCYGTNLRSVSSPLRPNATVTMNVKLKKNSSEVTTVRASFAGRLAGRGGLSAGGVSVSDPSGAEIVAAGNTAVIKLPVGSVLPVTVDGAGNYDLSNSNQIVQSVRFSQSASDTPTSNGTSGGLSASVDKRLSQDGRVLHVKARFPGADGFCGGYYSPLMVFYDDKRPKFTGKSKFPLLPHHNEVYWPENGSSGEFLALDLNGNGKIDTKSELFTDTDEAKNGFEALKQYDNNKDSKIDAKDEVFAKLILWKDENGNGESENREMKKASEKLVSISLNYNGRTRIAIGDRAEQREESEIVFRNPAGKRVKGKIIDYWFSPTE